MQDTGEGSTFLCLIRLTGGLTLSRSRKIHFSLLLLTFSSIYDLPVCVYLHDKEPGERREKDLSFFHYFELHTWTRFVISIALLKAVVLTLQRELN